MSEEWISAKQHPDTSRRVSMRFGDDGERDCDGFYWRPEGAWYRSDGSKRKKHAVHPTHWRELFKPIGGAE